MTGHQWFTHHPDMNVRKDAPNFGEELRPAGYRPMMVGKWHCDGVPFERGFERHFGHLRPDLRGVLGAHGRRVSIEFRRRASGRVGDVPGAGRGVLAPESQLRFDIFLRDDGLCRIEHGEHQGDGGAGRRS